MNCSKTKHISVLLNETVDMLNVQPEGIYVDGTLGRGGHSRKILEKLTTGKLYVFDLDLQAIEESKEILKDYDNVVYIHDNFMNMDQYVDKVDGILLDLGVSSPQFDEAERGFSYRFDGPLDMRMNQEQKLTAEEVVNTLSEKELADIFYRYSEEKFARPIARKIVENRPIHTTLELVALIKSALPAKVLAKKGHFAKQVFQALRIYVNKESDSLAQFLERFDAILNPGGRVVIITFHSLEDKQVKYRFKELSTVVDDLRIAKRPEDIEEAPYRLLVHKAVVADEEELENNHRAKSAKLRGIEKRSHG